MTNEIDGQIALDQQITQWRAYVDRRRELHHTDADELEDHLRDRIAELTEAGLRNDEAFLIAVKRMGSLNELSREFAREHSERLWKQLVLPEKAPPRARRELPVALVCAVVAAVAIKVPALFGADESFYIRNLAFLVLPPLVAYFAWQRGISRRMIGLLTVPFIVGAVAVNVYPMASDSQTLVLTAIHLPLALWLVVGVAYAGGDWRSGPRRMDFIRFTGEWLIYFALIGLGGGVLMAFTAGTFNAIGLNAEEFIGSWMLPCGAVGAVVVSAWLVEAKQSVIENMAPVLTRIFTPLFAVALLAFLAAFALRRHGIEREALVLFNLLLVVVLGLLLYSISARDGTARPGIFDWLQLALVVSALIMDLVVLVAITGRIAGWGFTPNKTAVLGENLILLANLAWSAWLFLGFVRGRAPLARLERWQTSYLTVYAAWMWIVVLVFPLAFGFD